MTNPIAHIISAAFDLGYQKGHFYKMTTAGSTKFCDTKLIGPRGYADFLYIDGNQKITAGNGTFEDPYPNAFSLLDRLDCPMRTPTCEQACYVGNLEKNAPEIHALYKHNSAKIREILIKPDRFVWANWLADWITDHCQGGFRWHVSGDIFSENYAEWIAQVVSLSPDVEHWIYTRSFPMLDPLLHVRMQTGNIAINLSADRDNYWYAKRVAEDHGLRICYLWHGEEHLPPDDLPEGSVIFPDYPLRPNPGQDPKLTLAWLTLPAPQRKMLCPVDYFGKSESIRCGVCRKCF